MSKPGHNARMVALICMARGSSTSSTSTESPFDTMLSKYSTPFRLVTLLSWPTMTLPNLIKSAASNAGLVLLIAHGLFTTPTVVVDRIWQRVFGSTNHHDVSVCFRLVENICKDQVDLLSYFSHYRHLYFGTSYPPGLVILYLAGQLIFADRRNRKC